MSIELDVLGYRYDNAEPAFVELTGGFYWHMPTNRRLDKDEFDAKLVAEGKSFAAGELGIPSLEYMRYHETILWSFLPPAGSAELTATVSKAPSGIDDTGEITIAGGPTNAPVEIHVLANDSTTLIEVPKIVMAVDPVSAETPTELGDRLAADAGLDPNFTSVVNVAGVVTFTPSAGGSITLFVTALITE